MCLCKLGYIFFTYTKKKKKKLPTQFDLNKIDLRLINITRIYMHRSVYLIDLLNSGAY